MCYTYFVIVYVQVPTPLHKLLEARRGHRVSCSLTPQLVSWTQGLAEPGAFCVEATSGFHSTCQVHASCPAFLRRHGSESGPHACAVSTLIGQGDGSLKYF